MVMTLYSARQVGSRQAGTPSAIQNLLNDRTIELPFPIYILHELAEYLTYSDIRALRFVSRGYFAWVYKSIPWMLELNADNCLIGGRYISSNPLAQFTNLNRLVLSHNFIDNRSVAPLRKLKFLRYLDLSHNTLRLPTDGSLAELTQLRTLILSGNVLRLQHLQQVQMLTKLEHLEMAEFHTLTAFPLENLTTLTCLTTLNLAKNFISSKAVKSLINLPRLMDLDLSFCTISSRHHLQKLTTLRRLNLSATALGFDRLCLSSLTQLEWLDISYNFLDDERLKNLALPGSLEELNIAAIGITEASFRELARLTNLKSIFLHENAMTDLAKQKYSSSSGLVIKPIPRSYKRELS